MTIEVALVISGHILGVWDIFGHCKHEAQQ